MYEFVRWLKFQETFFPGFFDGCKYQKHLLEIEIF